MIKIFTIVIMIIMITIIIREALYRKKVTHSIASSISCDLLAAFGGFPLDVAGMELHIEGHDVLTDYDENYDYEYENCNVYNGDENDNDCDDWVYDNGVHDDHDHVHHHQVEVDCQAGQCAPSPPGSQP